MPGADLLDSRNLTVARRDAQECPDLPAIGLELELRAHDMIGGDDTLERRQHNFLRRRRDHVEVEAVAIDPLREHPREELDVALEPDLAPDLEEIIPSDSRVLRIVREQVRQLRALLHEIEIGERRDFLTKARDPQHLAQHDAGVVKAQCLIEVTCQQVMLLHPHPPR